MKRPLLLKTIGELEEMVERNLDNGPALQLVLEELAHRSTQRSRELQKAVKAKGAKLTPRNRQPVRSKTGTYSIARGRPPLTLEDIAERVQKNWKRPTALRQYRKQLEKFDDIEAKALIAKIDDRLENGEGRRPPRLAPPPARLPTVEQPAPPALPPTPPQRAKIMSETRAMTNTAVAELRAKLLDLSRKSPLISFKHSGRSASMVRIVDERPDLMFGVLCGKEGMRFEPLPDEDTTPKDELTDEFRIAFEKGRLIDEEYAKDTEGLGETEDDAQKWETAERNLRKRVRAELGLPYLDYGKGIDVAALARAHGFDPSHDLKASDDESEDHHEDDRLRVLLTPKQLDTRLKSIWDRYRSHERETGLHTLFLAIGFVQWFDEQVGETPQFAPALLLAVELERKIIRNRYEYTLRPHEEGLQVNVALAEKMRQHWGLEMPTLRDDESPESYFVRLNAVLEKGRKLKLRRFVTLAVLPFPRMVLWKDLDPDNWPEDAFAEHQLLPGLLGAAPLGDDPSPKEPYAIDDPDWTARAPALVLPADASQHSALIEMAEGANLAIEGPPGTGKSQTIANMIATAVGQGKKVLFVAEKQAALRVVSDRLRDIGLAPLILELHGDGAKRDEFYKSLRERLDASVSSDKMALETRRKDLNARRDLLRNYLALLETPLGALGKSAYYLVWRELALRADVGGYAQQKLNELVSITAPGEVDTTRLGEVRDRLEIYARAVRQLDDGNGERTYWLHATRMPLFGQDEQLSAAGSAATSAKECGELFSSVALRGSVETPEPGGRLDAFAELLGRLPRFDDADENTAKAALRHPDLVRSLLQKQSRWRQLETRLRDGIDDPGSVSADTVERASAAFANCQPAPATSAAASDQLGACKALKISEASTHSASMDISGTLGVPDTMPVQDFQAVLETLSGLAAGGDRDLALMSPSLLDPVASLAVAEETAQAKALSDEQAGLAPSLRDGWLEEQPDELVRLAEILEESGLFARLFGSQFKAARKRVARLLRDAADREEAAELLRKVARHQRSGTKFHIESSARTLFPAIMWKGADSDFDSLVAVQAKLVDAQARFASVGMARALSAFLELDPQQRASLARKAADLSLVMVSASELGFQATPLGELGEAIGQRERDLAELVDVLGMLGAKNACQLVVDGEPLPGLLGGLIGSREEFDRLRSDDALHFVGPIDASMDVLARALAVADILRGLEDGFDLVTSLVSSDEPVGLLSWLADRAETVASTLSTWRKARDQFVAATGFADLEVLATGSSANEKWHSLAREFEGMADDAEGARLAADLLRYRAKLDDDGANALAQAALDGRIDGSELADVYELALVTRLLKTYLNGDGAALQRAGGLNLAAARESFAQIDSELHGLEAKALLAERLKDDAPWGIDFGKVGDYTNKALLTHELGLKKPRTPIRDVVQRAGKALQALKPVWMMSPASAAQYIRAGSLSFDILMVDEASQMRPEYAISSVLRGGQFVVVGDANQLPPSDHFQSKDGIADDGDDGLAVSADTESILDLANQRFRRKRRLKWHYRSQHESLIAFSNREFYESDLVVFPSPMGNDDDLLGLRCTYVPGEFPNTLYEASINQREAQAVIEEAFRLMRAYPQHSIGIAAMNAKQTDLISAEFDRLTLQQPEIRDYVDHYKDTIDEFFIKNLENVQGDERDIILISTVYGPDKDGTVKQNFGLMNREVGWRRLNVLVTRAKLSTRVFTSLRPGDIKATDTSSRGVRAFKSFLTFAQGGAKVDRADGGEPESPFELLVAEKLGDLGYDVVPQVGVENFRIDLGIRHPDYPLGFLAGIECDGAPFHSGFTVRDRDRIRQKQLENLGWRIYRIWSVDWYADQERETAKLGAWLDQIKERKLRTLTAKVTSDDSLDQSSNLALSSLDPSLADAAVQNATPQKAEEVNLTQPTSPAFPDAPVGTRMRDLDGIEWWEEEKGRIYTVWREGQLLGDVSVLSRGDSATRLYGDRIYAPKPEYEAKLASTGEIIRTNDIYAAVRKIARSFAIERISEMSQ